MRLPRRLALVLAATALVMGCSSNPQSPQNLQEGNRNIRFGMPGPAFKDPKKRENYLIEQPQYVLSYNDKKHTPNWVCWELRKDDIGSAPRQAFRPYEELPHGFVKIVSHEYNDSGFDRGHMCPAKDRSATVEDCKATFYTINLVPQSPPSNQHAWEGLEAYCRKLTQEGHFLQIACGPHGVGGIGKHGLKEHIGKERVTVPEKLWKVVMVLPRADAQPRKNTRVIAVIMPNNMNDSPKDRNWVTYRVSARAVEELTGYKFFPNVPEEVASAIKDRVDDVKVKAPRPRHPHDGAR